ncbi:MAG TPA: hypothetical protein VGB50_03445 [Flavobacterium sp.]|jgi:hypothetical protein
MKKLFLFLSAFSVAVLSSCSNDDDNNSGTPSSDVLVKRIVAHQEDPDGINYEVDYTYSGNKMVQGVYDDGYTEKYYYTGNEITKIEYIFDGDVEERELFAYNAQGKLIEYRDQDLLEDFEEVTAMAYNGNSTITQTISSGSVGDTSPTGETRTLTLTNGEVSQVVQTDGTVYNYTYDTRNSPFKNVTGFAEIAHIYSGDFEYEGRSKTIATIVDATHTQNYTVNTWQYNGNDYPTTLSSTSIFEYNFPDETETLTMQFFYE